MKLLKTYKLEIKRCFCFVQADQGVYNQKVRDMITKNRTRLIVNINDLRRKAPKRALRFVKAQNVCWHTHCLYIALTPEQQAHFAHMVVWG